MKISRLFVTVFLSVLLFSCCLEKKNNQPKEEAKSNNTVKVDSILSKAIIKEKDSDIPDEDFEEMERYFEEEWGPV